MVSTLTRGSSLAEFAGTDEAPKSTCPFTFYAQLDPSTVPEILMRELEEEVQRPTGRWTVTPPKLSVRGVLISKECGLLYELKDTLGLRCANYIYIFQIGSLALSTFNSSQSFFRKVTTCELCLSVSIAISYQRNCQMLVLLRYFT